MVKLNYENDFLLVKNKNKIFVDGYLNIYGALVKKKDIENNQKGEILKKCPYVIDKKNEILNIIKKLKNKNFLNIRNLLSKYLKINTIRKDTFDNWLNKKIYPMPLVRVICFLTNKNLLKVLKNKVITNFCKSSQIVFPSYKKEIISDFMAYFIGLHLGDGTLNKERWKIVDGDMDKENLKHSYDFLTKIKTKITQIFLIKSGRIYKIKNANAYELLVANRWFGRYLNFVYGIEQKKKEIPNIPNIIKDKKELILRGLFDTDGSIKGYRIIIGTKFYNLYQEICSILNKHKIEFRKKKNNIQRKNTFYMLEIQKTSINNFIKIIGFSHPRKLLEIKKYLLTTSSDRYFVGFNRKYMPQISKIDFTELCNYIRPIKNSGKIRFIAEFNRLNSKKKKRIINNFKTNFGSEKKPNKKGYIYSRKIERIVSNYCIYKMKRNKTEIKEIEKLIKKFDKIWN